MKILAPTGSAPAVDPNKGDQNAAAVDPSTGKVTVQPGEKPAGDQSRPSWLPPEFSSPEDFRKAWDEKNKPAADAAAAAAAQKVEQSVDMAALEKEYAENNGALTDATKAALKAKGITEEMVNEHIANRQTAIAAYEKDLHAHVGGKENLDTLLDWAGKNFTDAQVESFNKAMSNYKSPDGAKDALDLLIMKYERANGKQGKSVTSHGAQTVTPGSAQPIADMKELVALQSDPRYKRGDKAYHKMVDERLAASPDLFS